MPSALRDPAAGARVVVLTTGTQYGVLLLEALHARGGRPTVVLQSDAALDACFRKETRLGRLLEVPLAIARSGRRRWRERARAARLRPFAERLVITGARNSQRMRDDLAALAPDLLVLGGVGLLDERLLATARRGVLNGHPGLLPWVRGSGVVGHAVARGIAVGASCHRVNAGIDRGDVIERRLLPVEGPTTLAALERAAVNLAAELLADVVTAIVREDAAVVGVPQRELHPLCRWLTADERRQVEVEVAAGSAQEAFARWRACCTPSAPPWRLTPDAAEPSAAHAARGTR